MADKVIKQSGFREAVVFATTKWGTTKLKKRALPQQAASGQGDLRAKNNTVSRDRNLLASFFVRAEYIKQHLSLLTCNNLSAAGSRLASCARSAVTWKRIPALINSETLKFH